MTYIFLNGDVSDAAQVNDNFNKLTKLQGEKAINDVSATNSGVLAGSSQVLIDKFLDATGQNNTVDTGNTTGLPESINKYYLCGYGTSLAQPQTNALDEVRSFSEPNGVRIYVNQNCSLSSVTKSRDTGNRLLIKNNAGTTLATYDFAPGATNPMTLSPAYPLISGTIYRIEIVTQHGGAFLIDRSMGVGSLISNDYINYTGGSFNGADDVLFYAITSMEIKHTLIDSTIQSVATTIPTGMTKVFVTPLMYEALSTGDSITADVSIDNGSTYTTDIPINEWTDITSANGTQLIVKANLLTGDGSTSPKILGWRCLLE